MRAPFVVRRGRVSLRVGGMERAALESLGTLLDHGAAGEPRLDYVTHPHDPAAEGRYRELVGDDLDDLRRADRTSFELVASGAEVEPDEVEAFMRVVGEARLVLAGRLGIEDDGWEMEARPDDPEMAMLGWLGWLQDAAVEALSGLLD